MKEAEAKGVKIGSDVQTAIKVINKQGIEKYGDKIKNAIESEVAILRKMAERAFQPHIMGIYDCFQTGNHIYIVLELCTGGSLGDVLRK